MKLFKGRKIFGKCGTATEILFQFESSDPPYFHANLAAWFLDCPGQSPAWRHYHFSVVHLRDIPGVPPAHIREPGSTHEFMMMALDPKLNPVPDDTETWSPPRPISLVEQARLPSDEAAIHLANLCVLAVLRGDLWAEPPLAGQVEPWRSELRSSAKHAWEVRERVLGNSPCS